MGQVQENGTAGKWDRSLFAGNVTFFSSGKKWTVPFSRKKTPVPFSCMDCPIFPQKGSCPIFPHEDKELAELATCTPHVGASTDQASEAVGSAVVEIVRSYMSTGKPINTINVRSESIGACSLVVRHYNHVGVLAGVLDELREQNINVEEMENTIFEGGLAASCTLKLDMEPSDVSLKKIEEKEDIIQISVK
jgi:hypothetical protein